jgi:hypothetical protein
MNIAVIVESMTTKVVVTGVVALIFLVNVFYVINIKACQQANTYLVDENNGLGREIEQIDNQEAYQNSNLFEEKEIKENGYRLKGEQVLNTSLFESTPQNPDLDYIPELTNEDRSNFDRWMRLFGEGLGHEGEEARCGW